MACPGLWLRYVKPAAETLNMSGEPLFPEQLLETKFACLSITSKSGWRKALTVLLQDLSVRFHLIFEISRNSALRVRSHVRTFVQRPSVLHSTRWPHGETLRQMEEAGCRMVLACPDFLGSTADLFRLGPSYCLPRGSI